MKALFSCSPLFAGPAGHVECTVDGTCSVMWYTYLEHRLSKCRGGTVHGGSAWHTPHISVLCNTGFFAGLIGIYYLEEHEIERKMPRSICRVLSSSRKLRSPWLSNGFIIMSVCRVKWVWGTVDGFAMRLSLDKASEKFSICNERFFWPKLKRKQP